MIKPGDVACPAILRLSTVFTQNNTPLPGHCIWESAARLAEGVIESASTILGGFAVVPKIFPVVIGADDTELSDGVGALGQPGAAGLFESGVQDMLVA